VNLRVSERGLNLKTYSFFNCRGYKAKRSARIRAALSNLGSIVSRTISVDYKILCDYTPCTV